MPKFKDITNVRFSHLVVKSCISQRRNGKIMWVCQCDCGAIIETKGQSLISGKTRSCGCLRKTIQKTKMKNEVQGDRFGSLVLIKQINLTRYGHPIWECLCDCGNTTNVNLYNLRRGNTKSCGHLTQKGYVKNSWLGSGHISNIYWENLKAKAKDRDLKFNIDIRQAQEKFVEQHGICKLSGLTIDFTDHSKIDRKNQTACLDRIDSSDYYHIDNVQWVHKNINKIKYSFSEPILFHYVHLICQKRDLNQLDFIDFPIYKKHDCGFGYISGDFYGGITRRGKETAKYKREINISLEYLNSVFLSQNGRCKYTGLPLIIGSRKRKIETTASVDRINSKLGYIYDNVQFVHKHINTMKRDFLESDFLNYCHLINNYVNGGK